MSIQYSETRYVITFSINSNSGEIMQGAAQNLIFTTTNGMTDETALALCSTLAAVPLGAGVTCEVYMEKFVEDTVQYEYSAASGAFT